MGGPIPLFTKNVFKTFLSQLSIKWWVARWTPFKSQDNKCQNMYVYENNAEIHRSDFLKMFSHHPSFQRHQRNLWREIIHASITLNCSCLIHVVLYHATSGFLRDVLQLWLERFLYIWNKRHNVYIFIILLDIWKIHWNKVSERYFGIPQVFLCTWDCQSLWICYIFILLVIL